MWSNPITWFLGSLIIMTGLVGADFAGGLTWAAQASLIKIDGSSTVYPVTEAVAEEFQNAHRGKIRVTVGIAGSGGGFKKFCRGEIDIADASRPIMKEEMALCQKNGIAYYELPVAFDA
ncbi:MAG: substrate-binding domain-containing protein, partial [Nitrospira sp.]|nr:substrate-binding domain-containing protein [Nitrospira sp.]